MTIIAHPKTEAEYASHMRRLMRAENRKGKLPPNPNLPRAKMSKAAMQRAKILGLKAEGMEDQQIAAECGIALSTVYNYLKRDRGPGSR